jgi:Glutathione S-transferase, N-terminal domain
MLTLYYTPGACSMAAHIVLEESGEEYEAKKVDLAGGEQRTEAYLKINPLGRVPALLLDNGEPLVENTLVGAQAEGTTLRDAAILAEACVSAARRIMTELLAQRAGVPQGRA